MPLEAIPLIDFDGRAVRRELVTRMLLREIVLALDRQEPDMDAARRFAFIALEEFEPNAPPIR
jgi:hypothetical protein